MRSPCKLILTFAGTFTANASIEAPAIVHLHLRIPSDFAEQIPGELYIGHLESGWIKSANFYEYIGNAFIPWLNEHIIPVTIPEILFLSFKWPSSEEWSLSRVHFKHQHPVTISRKQKVVWGETRCWYERYARGESARNLLVPKPAKINPITHRKTLPRPQVSNWIPNNRSRYSELIHIRNYKN